MDDLIQLLHEGKHSLVVANGILWSLQMVRFAHSMVVVSLTFIICCKMIRASCMKHPSQIKSWVRPLRHCWLWQMSKRCMRMSSVGLPLTCFQKPI